MLMYMCRLTVRCAVFCFLIFATLMGATAFEDAKAQRVQEGDLTRSIGELRLLAKAVIGDAESGTPKRTICKTCFPAPISHWRAAQFYSLSGDRTNVAQDFLRHVRTVLTAAACDGNREALDEIYKISKRAEDAVLNEAEAIFLDHQSKRVATQLGFRSHIRAKEKQAKDTSRNWKRVSDVTTALRSGDVEGAVKRIPSLAELCPL